MFPTCKRSLKTWVSEGSRDGEINLNYTGGPNVTTKALTGEGRRQRRQRRRRDRNTGQRDCRMLRSCFEGGERSKVKERGQLPEAGRGRETSASIASWRKAARQRDRGPSRPMAWTCDVRNCKITHLCHCKRPYCSPLLQQQLQETNAGCFHDRSSQRENWTHSPGAGVLGVCGAPRRSGNN